MKLLILLGIFTLSQYAIARPIRVAVIDSGIQDKYYAKAKPCLSGHMSFVKGEGINDKIEHGTNVSGIIVKNAEDADYCLIFIKAFTLTKKSSMGPLYKSLVYARSLSPDIINLSAGGSGYDIKEMEIVKRILEDGIHFVVAAGNDGADLNTKCFYYPACYDKRLLVVGNKGSKSTNTGAVVDGYLPGNKITAFNITMSGTSQSVAVFTGKLIRFLDKMNIK